MKVLSKILRSDTRTPISRFNFPSYFFSYLILIYTGENKIELKINFSSREAKLRIMLELHKRCLAECTAIEIKMLLVSRCIKLTVKEVIFTLIVA